MCCNENQQLHHLSSVNCSVTVSELSRTVQLNDHGAFTMYITVSLNVLCFILVKEFNSTVIRTCGRTTRVPYFLDKCDDDTSFPDGPVCDLKEIKRKEKKTRVSNFTQRASSYLDT